MPPALVKFEEFELDSVRYELRRNGRALRIEKIPMDLLILLAFSGGRLVPREEMEAHLWGKEVFVDAEHGINTAIRKIRQVLGDDPDAPRFVQTVQRKGYRFIATVIPIDREQSPNLSPTNTETPAPLPVSELHLASDSLPLAAEAESKTQSARQSKPRLLWYGFAVVLLLIWPAIKFIQSHAVKPSAQAMTIQSIAVLPLENISGDPEQEYFADGMTDELITMLAKYRSLRVISRTSVMQYKKVRRSLPDIARELGVDGIIEGTVSRSQDRVRVRAQLLYAPTDTHLWAESYERGLGDVLSLQQELAHNIAEQVRATSSLAAVSAAPHPAMNLAAHDACLRGRYYWTLGRYDDSKHFFQEAIRLDPMYAAAYAGLADSYTASGMGGDELPLETLPKGEVAAKKALELDDSEAVAHHSMAAVKFFYHWDWEGAEKESERALELNPSFAEGHHLHAYILEVRNQPEESLREDKRAVELDPFERQHLYGRALYRAHRFEEALQELQHRPEMRPSGALHVILSNVYAHLGDSANAFAELKKAYQLDGDDAAADALVLAYRRGGFQAAREEHYRRMKETGKEAYVSPLTLAELASAAGHKEEALGYLEQALTVHDPMLVKLQHEPDLDSLHSEPRYVAIVKKIGLPTLP